MIIGAVEVKPMVDRAEDAAKDRLSDNERLFDDIYNAYAALLYTYIHRFMGGRPEADDLFQDTFLKVYRALHKLPVDPDLRPYLYKIARNTCIDWIRRPTHEVLWSDIVSEESDSTLAFPSGEEPIDDTYLRQDDLEYALAQLPASLRIPLILHVFDGFSYAEIAAMLGLKETGLAMRCFRARDMLRDYYNHAH